MSSHFPVSRHPLAIRLGKPPARFSAAARSSQSGLGSVPASTAGLRLKDCCFLGGVSALLWFGWSRRELGWIDPEEGLGYALGVTGGLLLLFMLVYPLRKRIRWMQRWGHMRFWFRSHMVVGIVAPSAILLHCNFRLGAVNSNVALFSLLAVVLSGLVGRFLYHRLHYTVRGHEITLQELQGELAVFRGDIRRDDHLSAQVLALLQAFEAKSLDPRAFLPVRWFRFFGLGIRARAVRHEVGRLLRLELWRESQVEGVDPAWARAQFRVEEDLVAEYVGAVHRLARFTAYLKLFGLWHVLHIPLMFMLAITAVAHVISVHLY